MRSKLILRQSGHTVRVQYKKATRAKYFLEPGVMAIQPGEAGLSRELIDQEMQRFIAQTRSDSRNK